MNIYTSVQLHEGAIGTKHLTHTRTHHVDSSTAEGCPHTGHDFLRFDEPPVRTRGAHPLTCSGSLTLRHTQREKHATRGLICCFLLGNTTCKMLGHRRLAA